MTSEPLGGAELNIGQWLVPELVLNYGGPRSALLIRQAYDEEALTCPVIDERVAPTVLLYPRTYVEAVSAMPGQKRHDYCFMGALFGPGTYQNRRWIFDLAARRFTTRSYFVVTDAGEDYERIGPFDQTNLDRDVFVPRTVPPNERAQFHDHYFRLLRRSQFTLCPAGDAPWSMRFFEAIMCHSIPIVSDREHSGRNELERSIGYRFLLSDEEHIYDEDVAEENFRLFVHHQTLISEGERA